MSAPGAVAAEFGPRVGQDVVWAALAGSLDAGQFAPVVLTAPEPDHFEPGVFEPAAAQPEAVAISPATGYFLGKVAVEQAGAVRMDSLPGEERSRARYDRFLGGVALYKSRAGEVGLQPKQRSSLDLLRSAAEGDAASFEALMADTRPHVYEILEGVGGRMESQTEIDAAGNVVWVGQTTEERQFNAATVFANQCAKVREAAAAEGRTAFRLEDRRRDGQLTDSMSVYEFSPVLDASAEDLAGGGYFVHTVSCALRRNRVVGNKLYMTSLFLGGVDERLLPPRHQGETEAEELARQQLALDNRFDVDVLAEMYELLLGIEDAGGMRPVDFLDTPIVTEEDIDDVDFAMLYDKLAAKRIKDDAKTFLGSVKLWQSIGSPETLAREHYEAYFAAQQQRYEARESLCQTIVTEQVRRHAEARTPREAVELKRQTVLDHIVDLAARDRTVDATRIGYAASELVDHARDLYDRGDTAGGDTAVKQAKIKAKDPSCPPGGRDRVRESEQESADGTSEQQVCKEVKHGDRVKCPYCGHVVNAVVPKKGGMIYCQRGSCSASLKRAMFGRKQEGKERKATIFGPAVSNNTKQTKS